VLDGPLSLPRIGFEVGECSTSGMSTSQVPVANQMHVRRRTWQLAGPVARELPGWGPWDSGRLQSDDGDLATSAEFSSIFNRLKTSGPASSRQQHPGSAAVGWCGGAIERHVQARRQIWPPTRPSRDAETVSAAHARRRSRSWLSVGLFSQVLDVWRSPTPHGHAPKMRFH
jgi:hypothetical protein